MKLGGCTLSTCGAWLVLSACSGRYDVGFEPMGGTAGTAGSEASPRGKGGSGSGSSASSGGSPSAVAGAPQVPVTGGSMSAGLGMPSPGPDSRCGFTPVVASNFLPPAASSAEVATRIYAFLEADEAPDLELPATPSPSWTANQAEAILDAHFDDGSSVPGLERFLEEFLSLPMGYAFFAAPGVWGAKLAAPDATLFTLLAEPTGEPHRLGILTHPELLALRPTITGRGLWMSDRLFCAPVPPPPPDFIGNVVPIEEGLSERQWLAREQYSPACVGCHNLVNPGGYSLEHFDSAGDYRELDNGVPVDASGTLVQAAMSFESFDDLAPQLAQSCEVARCFAGTLSGFAAQQSRQVGFSEAEANLIANSFADSGYSVRALVRAIVTSRAFFR